MNGINIAKVGGGVVALLVAAVFAQPAHAATNMVGHWTFDEGAGSQAADSSGFGNTGALAGGTQWVAGNQGGALAFDGTGSVRVPSSAALEPQALTVQAWIKRQGSPGAFHYIVAKGATSCVAASYAFYTGDSGGIVFYVSSAAGTAFTLSPDGGSGLWDGAWHRITGTFDGSTVRLYVDGAEVRSGTQASNPIDYGALDTRDLFVGRYPGCSGHDFTGSVDDVRIYGRALSPTEVATDNAYDFHGFMDPINNPPTVNSVKAGRAIPVKFSLSGFQGLGILAVGSPSSQRTDCTTSAPVDTIEQTTTAGASSLTYDAVTDQYTYVWKTESGWAGTCRQLAVGLDDGSAHVASFKFK